MKLLKNTFFLVLISTLLIACEEDSAYETNPIYNPEATGKNPVPKDTSTIIEGNTSFASNISITIKGITQNFSDIKWTTNTDPDGDFEFIFSDTTKTDAIGIYLEAPAMEKTYTINDTSNFIFYTRMTANDTNLYYSTSGSMTVSELDLLQNTIQGSFNVMLDDLNDSSTTIVLASGSFKAKK
jgi:hypothetical protein